MIFDFLTMTGILTATVTAVVLFYLINQTTS